MPATALETSSKWNPMGKAVEQWGWMKISEKNDAPTDVESANYIQLLEVEDYFAPKVDHSSRIGGSMVTLG